MDRKIRPVQVFLALVVIAALSGCSLGQTSAPAATQVDVNAVMTSAAGTAFVQLTQIAGQASATIEPSQTPKPAAPVTSATPAGGLQLVTATEGAGGLPAVNTQSPANTPGAVGKTPGAAPSLTPLAPIGPSGGNTTVSTCLNSQFVADITISDGTAMAPYQKFTKIWSIKNTGTCAWDQGFGLVLWAGPSMGGGATYFSGNDEPVQPGGTVDMSVEMRAPPQKGEYVAHWMMISDTGKLFGGDLTVFIKVQ